MLQVLQERRLRLGLLEPLLRRRGPRLRHLRDLLALPPLLQRLLLRLRQRLRLGLHLLRRHGLHLLRRHGLPPATLLVMLLASLRLEEHRLRLGEHRLHERLREEWHLHGLPGESPDERLLRQCRLR